MDGFALRRAPDRPLRIFLIATLDKPMVAHRRVDRTISSAAVANVFPCCRDDVSGGLVWLLVKA